jgi:hypothetical protein
MGWGKAVINMKCIVPSLNLQSEENWTITNYTVTTLPFTFSTRPSNTTAISNGSVFQLMPYVFNGTIINVKVEVYQYHGQVPTPFQLLGSNEWNVTEYVYT